jgi:hypothetical protein
MTDTQEKILGVFKEHKVSKDGRLKPQSLSTRSWDEYAYTDEFQDAIKQLIDEDYISFDGNSYILCEKGYEHIQ